VRKRTLNTSSAIYLHCDVSISKDSIILCFRYDIANLALYYELRQNVQHSTPSRTSSNSSWPSSNTDSDAHSSSSISSHAYTFPQASPISSLSSHAYTFPQASPISSLSSHAYTFPQTSPISSSPHDIHKSSPSHCL